MAVASDHANNIQEIIQNLGKVAVALTPAGKKTTENVATALESLKKCVEDLANIVQKIRKNKQVKQIMLRQSESMRMRSII